VVGAATLAWLKRKAITALTGAARDRFWNYVREKVAQPASPTTTSVKTYKGTFCGYSHNSTFPGDTYTPLATFVK
jgi:hypothetical protein